MYPKCTPSVFSNSRVKAVFGICYKTNSPIQIQLDNRCYMIQQQSWHCPLQVLSCDNRCYMIQQQSWHCPLQVGIYFFPPPSLVNTFSISEDEKLISYSAHRISLWPCSYLVFRPCILDSRLLSAWSNFREIVFRLSLIWGVLIFLVRVYSTWLVYILSQINHFPKQSFKCIILLPSY